VLPRGGLDQAVEQGRDRNALGEPGVLPPQSLVARFPDAVVVDDLAPVLDGDADDP
jgi:hypothetical protein